MIKIVAVIETNGTSCYRLFSQGGFDFTLAHPWTQFAFFSLIVLFIGHIIWN